MLLQGTVAFVVIMLVMATLHGWEVLRMRHQVVFLEHQYSFLKTESDHLKHKVTAGHLDAALAEQVENLETKLNSQQQLQSLLKDDLFSSGQGYSRYLIALARQHVRGLWLTGITLSGAGHDIALRGQALRADLLPRYLQNLSREPLMQGLKLRVFQLNRDTGKSTSKRSAGFEFLVATSEPGGDRS